MYLFLHFDLVWTIPLTIMGGRAPSNSRREISASASAPRQPSFSISRRNRKYNKYVDLAFCDGWKRYENNYVGTIHFVPYKTTEPLKPFRKPRGACCYTTVRQVLRLCPFPMQKSRLASSPSWPSFFILRNMFPEKRYHGLLGWIVVATLVENAGVRNGPFSDGTQLETKERHSSAGRGIQVRWCIRLADN